MSDLAEAPDLYNAADPAKVQGRQSKAKREQAEADSALRNLLNTTPGRRWVWQLLCECGVFASSFRDSALVMAFEEGKRNVGLRLLADVMRVAPEQYQTMAEENRPPS
jgi:hypothetical protein